ncbi:DUF6968 family protein [Nocardia sp. NPDC057227]|uniref:DUF6968 family protein n=1 Tax=Nocardia sp. NPDC057227 TaxID=3346056 RepID=UPI0036334CCD
MRPIDIRAREDTAPPAVGRAGHHTGGHQWRRIRDVIASRTVADGVRPVSIEIGAPQVAAETQGVVCGFRIAGIGERWASGTDSLAALYRALLGVADDLAEANRRGARFELLDPADLAFPAPATGSTQRPADPEHTPQSLVAARTLHGADGPYSIIIGRPYPSEDGRYALCRFHISEHRPAVASGVDGIQALLTAFRMIAGLRDLPADWPVSRLA